MDVKSFDTDAGRDLGPLIHALRPHGGTLTFAEWVTAPSTMTVDLHLPEDPEQVE